MSCWFAQCKWQHIADIQEPPGPDARQCGLYQCLRCKDISVGSLGNGRLRRSDQQPPKVHHVSCAVYDPVPSRCDCGV